jgi:DNA-binding MarR family transcriptional regulator
MELDVQQPIQCRDNKMAESNTQDEKEDGAAATAPREPKIEDIAGVVADMNRFLSRLAGLPPFTEAKLALAEWLVLIAVSQTNGMPVKQLSKMFGIVQLRVNQLVDRLKSGDLVAVTRSEENPRLEIISLTDMGKERLNTVNASLHSILMVGLGNNQRSLFAVERNLKPLLRVVTPPKPVEQQ